MQLSIKTHTIKMAKASSSSTIDWTLISAHGPAVVFHTACIVGDKLYVHGGLVVENDNMPVNGFYCLDLRRNIWNEIQSPGSPSLSHHTSIVLHEHYMLLIGGWNGKSRSANLHCFDTATMQWTEMKHSGYPKEAGLSSHSSILCENNKILVVGREGHLHSQRKHNSAYIISGDPVTGYFSYSLLTYEVASRSGHTCNSDGRWTYLIGGRKDNFIETVAHVKSYPQLTSSVAKKLKDFCEKLVPMSKYPSGRKHHAGVGGHGVIFIHGGETFESAINLPSGEMYVFIAGKSLNFYKVGIGLVSLKGHICCCYNDKIIIHGGVSGKRHIVKGDTYELIIP
ncbi:kelch domain-containing protein 9 isoform X2 [Octopus sinensis]|uniref:Kelch domain-containing protein 9 isoform X2 n=1 Tax=Octopus sinensis TaxID=2607531 RepID=A0A6P7TGE6_9MOLL|nr:kelch domain-containing protein 9 isoform X2 [Octopus sinensis]